MILYYYVKFFKNFNSNIAFISIILQSKVRKWLKNYVNNGGTVFINTHLLENAERLCDRAAIIHQGEIQSLITLKDLRKQELTLEKLFHEIVK